MSILPVGKMKIDPARVIEIVRFGRFYVLGAPKYVVMHVPDLVDKSRDGYIIMEEDIVAGAYQGNLHMYNAVCKMTKQNKLIPALFKNPQMAEDVALACNRLTNLKKEKVFKV